MKSYALRGLTLLFGLLASHSETGFALNTDNSNLIPLSIEREYQPFTPGIIVSPSTLPAFTTAVGSASATQAVTVNGTDLSGNVTATASAGFEIAWNPGGNFSSSQTLTQSAGTVTNIPLYIRMTGAALGSVSGTVTLASSGAPSQSVVVSGTVTAAPTPNPAATVTSISPNSGGAGPPILVNFYGTDFVPGASVSFGASAYAGPTTFISSTHLTAMVTVEARIAAATIPVAVTNPAPGGGNTPAGAVTFTCLPSAPVITSFSPSSGPVGTQVIIRGSSLYVYGASINLSFNGTRVTFVLPGATEVYTSVPVGATTGFITLTNGNGGAVSATPFVVTASPTALFENFETGNKTSYAASSVQLQSGGWTFSEALIGTTDGADKFNGSKAVRLRGGGFVEMDVDKSNGAGVVTVNAANYSTETGASFIPEISSDGGVTYSSLLGSNPAPTLTGTLTPYSFTVNRAGNVRLRFRSTNTIAATNPRINLDDISITDYNLVASVQANQALPGLQVYPNPALNQVVVSGMGTPSAQVALYDLVGHLVVSPAVLLDGKPLALPAGLPAGTYLLHVNNKNGQRVMRVMKE